MKRKLGTFVLFALVILTAAALTKVEAPTATAIGSIREFKSSNN